MKIGGAWTRTSEKTGKTFISAIFDNEFLELCPQLKNCSLMLNYVSADERKTEKSPGWTVNLVKNNDNYNKKQETAKAEQSILDDAESTQTSESIIKEDEIPF